MDNCMRVSDFTTHKKKHSVDLDNRNNSLHKFFKNLYVNKKILSVGKWCQCLHTQLVRFPFVPFLSVCL